MEYIVIIGVLFGLPIIVAKKNLMSSYNPTDSGFSFFFLACLVFCVGAWYGMEYQKTKVKWDVYCSENNDGSMICHFPKEDIDSKEPQNSGYGKYNE